MSTSRLRPVSGLLAATLAALLCTLGFAVRPSSQVQAALSPPFHLHAEQIEAKEATLHINVLHLSAPATFDFDSATITGLQITRKENGHILTITAFGIAKSGHTTIKTTGLNFVSTMKSISLDDLLKLLGGKTMPDLVMKNVDLNVDGSLDADSLTLPGMHLDYK